MHGCQRTAPLGNNAIVADEDLFFILRKGIVWACWLSGKPAVPLGSKPDFAHAVSQFRDTIRAQKSSHGDPPNKIGEDEPPQLDNSPDGPEAQDVEVSNNRLQERHDLTVIGRVFSVGGSREVTILDLSESGCRFHDNSRKLALGHHITVKIGHVGPVEGTVRWRRDDVVGVRFNSPLHPSVLDYVRGNLDVRKK